MANIQEKHVHDSIAAHGKGSEKHVNRAKVHAGLTALIENAQGAPSLDAALQGLANFQSRLDEFLNECA